MSSIFSAFDSIVYSSNKAFFINKWEIRISNKLFKGVFDSLFLLTIFESPSYKITFIFVIVVLLLYSLSKVFKVSVSPVFIKNSRISALTII